MRKLAALLVIALAACNAKDKSAADNSRGLKIDEPVPALRQIDNAEKAKVTAGLPRDQTVDVATQGPTPPGTEAGGQDGQDFGRYRGDDHEPAEPADHTPGDDRKIIHTGSLSIVVARYDDARAKIDALVKAAGGYVDSTRVDHRAGQVSDAVIVIRVPTSGFGDLIPHLRELGEVQSESTDASDVTAEYTDVAARLASARTLEKRLLDLAANHTATVQEVLEVERELARVHGDIDQFEGRIRLWNDQVSLSTLTLSLSTTRPELAAPAAPSFTHRASQALDQSIATLATAGRGLALALVALLPWLPLLLPLAWLTRRAYRRWGVLIPRAFARVAPPPPPLMPTPMPMPAPNAPVDNNGSMP